MLKIKEQDGQVTCPVTIDSGRIRWLVDSLNSAGKKIQWKDCVLNSELQIVLDVVEQKLIIIIWT